MSARPRVEGAGLQENTVSRRRLVLLGASNVHYGLGTLVGVGRRLIGEATDFHVAAGHGRSFGYASSIPGRTLPAVIDCRLWDELSEATGTATHSLVTDIGNDLLYGRSPEQVAEWVESCCDRLAAIGPVTLTGLPVANLATLGPVRYRMARTIFFPRFRLSLVELAELALELNDRLGEIASRRGHTQVSLPTDWYGYDPIHFRPRRLQTAWSTLLSAALLAESHDTDMSENTKSRPAPLALDERARLWTSAPAEQKMLGRKRTRTQPCVVFHDGSRLSLY